MKGKVYLVGAGPGDPDLLTVKALRLLQTAEVVLHDDLVAPEILKLVPPSAKVQNVGKRCGKKVLQQEEINFLMIGFADAGRQVVRLKSGDPMIFGRAGEEIEALRGWRCLRGRAGCDFRPERRVSRRNSTHSPPLLIRRRVHHRSPGGRQRGGELEEAGRQRCHARHLHAGQGLLQGGCKSEARRSSERYAMRHRFPGCNFKSTGIPHNHR